MFRISKQTILNHQTLNTLEINDRYLCIPKAKGLAIENFLKILVEHSNIGRFFDSELMDYVDSIKLSDRKVDKRTQSNTHKCSRRLKCMAVCSMLANCMDPRACFMQTLLGLNASLTPDELLYKCPFYE